MTVAAAAKTALAAVSVAFACTTAPAAADTIDLGEPADVDIVDIEIEQHWTVSDLRPSSDVIAYQPAGSLWEATATAELDHGGVPVISGFAARTDAESYPVLWTVASPLGLAPTALGPGGSATGKLYFDVTGAAPTSVVYTVDGEDVVSWQ